MKKIKITKKFLIQEYIKNKKSPYKIAEEINSSPNNIRYYLKKYKIRIRNRSESQKGELGNNYIDGRTDKKYYCKQKNCNNEISYACFKYANENCDECGLKEISKKAKGRKRPDISEINRKRTNENHPRYNEERHKIYYCKECENEISYQTWKYGSGLCNSCKLKGKRSSTYIDGRSYFPYPQEFNDSLKLKIRTRDNFECQGKDCSMTEEEHLIVYGRVLDIHHIDYNKENCKEENLISLCKQCNMRANYNRNYWQEYFQNRKIRI